MKKTFYSFLSVLLIAVVIAGCGSSGSAPSAPPASEPSNAAPPASAPSTGGEQQPSGEKQSVRIGTSSAGSPFYVLTVGMSEMINKHSGNVTSTVEAVGGSDPNVFAIDANKVDMAMIAAFSARKGLDGEAPFNKKIDLQLVAQGQKTYRQIVVTTASGIKKPEDLVGKTIIGQRPAIPELEMIGNALFEVYNIPKDKVKVVSTVETKEAVEALTLGSVDAAILPAGLGSGDLAKLFQEKKIEFLDISPEKQAEMLKLLPASFSAAPIPANTYENQSADANAFAFNVYLVANGKLSEDVVYQSVKAIMDNTAEYHQIHNEAKQWTVENSLTDPKLPFHPGAIKYYKEIGKWDSSLDQIQASLTAK